MNVSFFSAHIGANQGIDNPAAIPDVQGWTVWKQSQTEIYIIKHDLGLTDPERQLHIVATPMDTETIIVVSSIESDQFTISTWAPGSIPKASAFMFIATYRP